MSIIAITAILVVTALPAASQAPNPDSLPDQVPEPVQQVPCEEQELRSELRSAQSVSPLRPSDEAKFFDSGSAPDGVAKAKDVVRDGRYAFVAFQTWPGYIVSYDVCDPTNPELAQAHYSASLGTVNGGYQLAIEGDTLFVGQNRGSFTAIDISDPTAMTTLAHVGIGGQGFDVAAAGDILYTADPTGALRVFDVADPANPSPVTTRGIAAGGVDVEGDHLYATDDPNDQMVVYNVSDPLDPRQVATYGASFGTPVQVDVHEDYAYVQQYQGTQIDVVDVSDPATPTKVTTLTTPSTIPSTGAVDVLERVAGDELIGDRLVVATGDGGGSHVGVYSTADLSAPLAEHTVPGDPVLGAPDIAGKFVYLPNYTDRSLTTVQVADLLPCAAGTLEPALADPLCLR